MKRSLIAILLAGMLLLALGGSALAAGKLGGAGGADQARSGEEIPTLVQGVDESRGSRAVPLVALMGSKLGVGVDG